MCGRCASTRAPAWPGIMWIAQPCCQGRRPRRPPTTIDASPPDIDPRAHPAAIFRQHTPGRVGRYIGHHAQAPMGFRYVVAELRMAPGAGDVGPIVEAILRSFDPWRGCRRLRVTGIPARDRMNTIASPIRSEYYSSRNLVRPIVPIFRKFSGINYAINKNFGAGCPAFI